MILNIRLHRKPRNKLEEELVKKAQQLVQHPEDIQDALQLFLVLSIYKLQIENRYSRTNPDTVQINLTKDNVGRSGLRIFIVGQSDSARVIQINA